MTQGYKSEGIGTEGASMLGKERRRPVDVVLRDGRVIKLLLYPEVFKAEGSPFTDQQRSAITREALRRQYDMSWGEIAGGVAAHIASGGSLGTTDEIAGTIQGIMSGGQPEAVKKGIAYQRGLLDMLSLKYPYLAIGAETVGASLPVVIDAIFNPLKGTLSAAAAANVAKAATRNRLGVASTTPSAKTLGQYGAMQRAASKPSYVTGMQETLHPFRMGSTTLPKQTLESAGKGGALGLGYGLGVGEGSLEERMPSGIRSGNFGALLGGAAPPLIAGVAGIPKAWKSRGDIGPTTLAKRGQEMVLSAMRGSLGEIADQSRLLNARKAGETSAPSVGKFTLMDEPFYSDIWGTPMRLSPTAGVPRGETNAAPNTNKMLFESLGRTTVDPNTGKAISEPVLPGLARWAMGEAPVGGGVTAGRLGERATLSPELVSHSLRRGLIDSPPIPFTGERALTKIASRSRPIWEKYYNTSYFDDAGEVISVGLSGTRNRPGFVVLFEESPSLKKAYNDAVINRGDDIGSGNWDRTVHGISQRLPTYEMFIRGERYIPKSTWGDNASSLGERGWERLKHGSGDKKGQLIEKDLNGHKMYIAKNKDAGADIKTLHDIRQALDDRVNAAKKDGGTTYNTLVNLRASYDKKLKATAPDSFGLADAKFATHKGVEEASAFGRTALTSEAHSPIQVKEIYDSYTPDQQRVFKSSLIEQIESQNITPEQILSNNSIRRKIEPMFPDTDTFGDVLAELHNLKRGNEMASAFSDPTVGKTMVPKDFNGYLWRLFAKIPAYKFSPEFAAARDMVELSRFVSKSNNRIVAEEMNRLLTVSEPAELSAVLKELHGTYHSRFPKDATVLLRLSNLIKATFTPQQPDSMPYKEKTLLPEGVSRKVEGLLDAMP